MVETHHYTAAETFYKNMLISVNRKICFRIKIFSMGKSAVWLLVLYVHSWHNSVIMYYCIRAEQKLKELSESSLLLPLGVNFGWLRTVSISCLPLLIKICIALLFGSSMLAWTRAGQEHCSSSTLDKFFVFQNMTLILSTGVHLSLASKIYIPNLDCCLMT